MHKPRTPLLSRRALLTLAGTAALGWPLSRALALSPPPSSADEYFLFLHAAGGWDVTLWADPRNERRGIMEPASTDNTDTAPIRRWEDQPLDSAGGGGGRTFKLLQPPGCNPVFGPSIGNLLDHYDRLCVVNGLAMNTVSHPDGTALSVTGRHLQGSRVPQPSLNTVMASEFGTGQTLPSVSVQYPSSYVGESLDRRAVPLSVERIGSISRSLTRSALYTSEDDRAAVTELLRREASELAAQSAYPDVLSGMALQYSGLKQMLSPDMQDIFNESKLKTTHPEFNYKARFHAAGCVNAAFAIEALRRNVARVVSFALGGFDTHANNYRLQALCQQDLFDLLAVLLRKLDATPHPHRAGAKLSDHTHILLVSDFCRTPQINIGGGRDHYPNNSALVISPRFRGNFVFGKSDPDQLLPAQAKTFSDGERPIAPPDLLATFLHAFGVPPRKYLRDGEVVSELLRP
jgi:hypothetical protein